MDKEYHTIRGAVFSVSADNYQPMDWLALANASVMVSFAVTAFYTVMKWIKKLMRTSVLFELLKLTHSQHLKSENPNTLCRITGLCPFKQISHYKVTQSFPPGLMHNILEGVIPQLLKLLLHKLHEQRVVSLRQFNKQMQEFSFGPNGIKSKPVLLKPTVSKQCNSKKSCWKVHTLQTFTFPHW